MMESQFSHFDADHWLRVKAERNRLGIVRKTEHGATIDHPLVGQTLVAAESGNTYLVERVRKQWWKGWYMLATLNRNGERLHCVVANQTSSCPSVQQNHEVFQEVFPAYP